MAKEVTKKVVFTVDQMYEAKDSGKFKDHRQFIAWLFWGQHKLTVFDHTKLIYDYDYNPRDRKQVAVYGVVGQSLSRS